MVRYEIFSADSMRNHLERCARFFKSLIPPYKNRKGESESDVKSSVEDPASGWKARGPPIGKSKGNTDDDKKKDEKDKNKGKNKGNKDDEDEEKDKKGIKKPKGPPEPLKPT